MATARTDPNDFDAVLEDLFLSENTAFQKGYEKGYQIGKTSGNPQGYHLGYHRGAALGREFGFYLSIVDHHIELNDSAEVVLSERINLFLLRLKKLLEDFPYYNYSDENIHDRVKKVRTRYKKACELLKISSDCPFDGGNTF